MSELIQIIRKESESSFQNGFSKRNITYHDKELELLGFRGEHDLLITFGRNPHTNSLLSIPLFYLKRNEMGISDVSEGKLSFTCDFLHYSIRQLQEMVSTLGNSSIENKLKVIIGPYNQEKYIERIYHHISCKGTSFVKKSSAQFVSGNL